MPIKYNNSNVLHGFNFGDTARTGAGLDSCRSAPRLRQQCMHAVHSQPSISAIDADSRGAEAAQTVTRLYRIHRPTIISAADAGDAPFDRWACECNARMKKRRAVDCFLFIRLRSAAIHERCSSTMREWVHEIIDARGITSQGCNHQHSATARRAFPAANGFARMANFSHLPMHICEDGPEMRKVGRDK
jgi:hypothetical protein